MSVREVLRVRPGKVDLADYDSSGTPLAPGDKIITKRAMAARHLELASLQERLYAAGTAGDKRRLLLVLQGMDTSGKGGVVEHVVGAFGPAGLKIATFKKPTPEELAHHFLWRIRKQLPGPGIVGVFDRSQYEDVLIVRVHGLVPETTWRGRYDEINDFEQKLADDGVVVVKCFLHISYDTQRERLLARLDDPTKHWKFREADIDERGYWKDYQAAYCDVLEKCSSQSAPWFIVPSDRKWYRNWAIGEILRETLYDMDPQYPKSDLDIPALKARLQPPH